jgi:GDSL-like Lipase/Acylhydrolase family
MTAMTRAPASAKLRRWGRWLLVWTTLVVIVPFLLSELGLRVYQRKKLGIPIFQFGLRGPADGGADASSAVVGDPRLGWRPSSAYRFHGEVRDADGTAHVISVTQHELGLRSFGDPIARRPKVLAIGDSYTQATCVGDGETYYDRLGAMLGAEVFGVGCSGWGTLQEWMYLDEIIDRIRPDVIIWQFSNNDYMDNDFALGRGWRAGCQAMVRPYWEDGDIVYRYSCHGPWATWSRLGYLITTRLDRARAPAPGHDELMGEIMRRGKDHPGFRAAAEVTSALFDQVRARVGRIPVVLVNLESSVEPFASVTRELAEEHGFYYVASLPWKLQVAEKAGEVVRCQDGVHFNGAGHRIIAETLARKFAAVKLPPKPKP